MANTPPSKATPPADQPAPKDTEVQRLRAENERLRAELAEAKANAKARPNTRPQPQEPSFGLSEGERAEMETLRHRREAGDDVPDTVTSPFTGRERGIDEAK